MVGGFGFQGDFPDWGGSLSSLSEDEGVASESSGASVGPWLCRNMQFFPFLHFPFAKYLHVTCILADDEVGGHWCTGIWYAVPCHAHLFPWPHF